MNDDEAINNWSCKKVAVYTTIVAQVLTSLVFDNWSF